jgi:hypothetical protein
LRRETITFFRAAFEANGWKTVADEPLTKRITISDYPAVTYNFSPLAAVPPVATRDILDRLATYPPVIPPPAPAAPPAPAGAAAASTAA